jgi:hypothetical protein
MLGADRAEATSSASSSTTTRCSAAQSFMVIWLMAGGAPLAPPGPPSKTGSRPPTPEPAVKGRPKAERGHFKADPGAGVPVTSGVEPYSAAALDGGRWRDTHR